MFAYKLEPGYMWGTHTLKAPVINSESFYGKCATTISPWLLTLYNSSYRRLMDYP